MGQARQKRLNGFSEDSIKKWEEADCVDFAVALARKTGWLLHVDWAASASRYTADRIHETNMIPIRVYVADDKDKVFDVRGIKTIQEFNLSIMKRVAQQRIPVSWRSFGVATRAYSEEELWKLPLKVLPDEGRIQDALNIIENTSPYLGLIPPRPEPTLPAKVAYEFAFGKCVVYAAAYEDVTGVKAVALCIDELLPGWEGSDVKEDGFVHSFIPREGGWGEDSWGRQPMESIARRFGGKSWHFDRAVHLNAVSAMKRNTPENWAIKYQEASTAIRTFVVGEAHKP